MSIKIIDISSYQPKVDYAAVKAAGVQGVILRCGVTYYGKQVCAKDECFEKHYAGFKAVGLPIGAYYYSAADCCEVARREADFVIKTLAGKQLELPIYYDVECDQRMSYVSRKSLTEICETFCEKLEAADYFVGVYANTNYFQNKLDHDRLAKKYTLWLADYRGTKANQSLKRDIWQYSSTGSVKGIDGNVDMNECYRDFTKIIPAAGFNGFKSVSAAPAPAPKPYVKNYTVKPGDSWWGIAASELGNGARFMALAAFNGKTIHDVIHPGDVLKIPTT